MLFRFGSISIKLLIPLAYLISCVLRSNQSIFSSVPNPCNLPFFSTILSSFGELSAGFLELISRIRQKKNMPYYRNSTFNESLSTHTGITRIQRRHKNITIKHLVIISGISLSNYIITFLTFYYERNPSLTKYNLQYEFKFIGIIYVSFLCVKLLKQDFQKHHILSLIVIGVCLLCVGLVNILSIKDFDSGYIKSFFILLVCDMYFSSKHCLERWLMHSQFISPFLLLFIEGIFSFIIGISSFVTLPYIPCFGQFCEGNGSKAMFNFKFFKEDITVDSGRIIYFIFFYLFSFSIELFMELTILYFSPAYRPIFDVIGTVCGLFFTLKVNANPLIFSVKLFFYLIIVLCCLIFNEILIVKAWGLDEGIKGVIAKRGDTEYTKCKEDIQQLARIEKEERERSVKNEEIA